MTARTKQRSSASTFSKAVFVGSLALTIAGVSTSRANEATLRQHPVLGTYQLDDSLVIELMAQEPLVFDPIDLEFDLNGDAWVLEMIGYPIVEESAVGPGRVVRLRDTNSDAVFDERVVFADGLRYASSILPYLNGILVADPPDLLFLKDTTGDGRADLRQVLISGFAVGPSESNFNGMTYGPDNWVHGANGSSGGAVFFPESPDTKTSIRGQDLRFRFVPDSDGSGRVTGGEMESVGRMGGGYGVTFDRWGRRYVTHEQRHIQAVMLPYRYSDFGGISFSQMARSVVEISDHGQGDASRIFPISTTSARPNHPEQAGFFTAGCGLTHFGSDALGPSFEGNFFIGEPVHNLVHRDVLEDAGTLPVATRAATEQRREFLAVKDPAFRAVNFATGPDGALYLVDMQRDVIEHPEWIPDEIEATLDLTSGTDRGRIYRIRQKEPTTAHSLGEKNDGELQIKDLGDKNQWRRFATQRMLVERAQSAPESKARVAADLVEGLFRQDPTARLHRLWVLDGIGALAKAHAVAALDDPHPRVQEAGLRLAEQFLPGANSRHDLEPKILALCTSQDPRLKLQAILTASLLDSSPARTKALNQVARTTLLDEQESKIFETALLFAAARSPTDFTAPFARGVAEQQMSPALLTGLAELIHQQGDVEAIADLLELAVGLAPGDRLGVLEQLGQGKAVRAVNETVANRMAKSLQRLPEDLKEGSPEEALFAWRIEQRHGLRATNNRALAASEAAAVVLDREQTSQRRQSFLPLLEMVDENTRVKTLLDLLSLEDPSAIQLAALEQLSQIQSDKIAPALVERWRTLSPKVRTKAGDLLLLRRSNHEILLDALENGPILLGEMNLHLERRRTLLRWSTPEVGERARKLFSDLGVNTRRQAYEEALPALELEGDPARGLEVFEELCSKCHAVSGVGTSVGPDLTDVFRKSGASLLHDIIDPNAAVSNEYLAYDIETKSGELHSGLLIQENDHEIVLRSAEGAESAFSRNDLKTLESSGLSLMPEELEIGLQPTDIASLLAFLIEPR